MSNLYSLLQRTQGWDLVDPDFFIGTSCSPPRRESCLKHGGASGLQDGMTAHCE